MQETPIPSVAELIGNTPFAEKVVAIQAQHAAALDELMVNYAVLKGDAERIEMKMRTAKSEMANHLGYFGDKYTSPVGSVSWRAAASRRSVNYDAVDAVANALDAVHPKLAEQLRHAITVKEGEPTLAVVIKSGGERE